MQRKDFPSNALFANYIRELYYLGGYTIPQIGEITNLVPFRVKYYLYGIF